ncbi:hypothetical protein OEG84_18635 [Hoeflea sp. G2-23]|uniref:Uncharacterized protein n=1 Tax=Hoeflea algicola TaxID=2983763 RepID=A0ABT3ZCY7_9HYPH|nr:hypothetical protein [Hoeflea algicola]MCY0149670.1 hypothetical protein [Hoeflea algicola]
MFMDTYSQPDRFQQRLVLFALAVAAIVASLFVDMTLFDRTFLSEAAPDWQLSGAIRIMLSLTGGLAIAFAVIPDTLPEPRLFRIGGVAGWSLAAICLISYGVHVWTVYALAQTPEALRAAVSELGPIAVLQEAAIALALVFLVVTFAAGKGLRDIRVLGLPGRLLAAGMALAVLLLLLEETSYGQHYFGWGTPAQFEGNTQQETNLHNFYTIRFEMIYYGVAFAAFVLAPLLLQALPGQLRGKLDHFIPPADFTLLAMPLVAGMYASWNIMPQQMMFFAGILIFAVLLLRWRMVRTPAMAGLAIIIAVQVLYLLLGSNQSSGYEVAEIRENSICFALLGYAVWFWLRNRRAATKPDHTLSV